MLDKGRTHSVSYVYYFRRCRTRTKWSDSVLDHCSIKFCIILISRWRERSGMSRVDCYISFQVTTTPSPRSSTPCASFPKILDPHSLLPWLSNFTGGLTHYSSRLTRIRVYCLNSYKSTTIRMTWIILSLFVSPFQLFYKNGGDNDEILTRLEIPGCPNPCAYSDFRILVAPYVIEYDQWSKECLKDENVDGGWSTIVSKLTHTNPIRHQHRHSISWIWPVYLYVRGDWMGRTYGGSGSTHGHHFSMDLFHP